MRVGGTPGMATLEIVEPTDKDKGVYTFELIDNEKSYIRTIELSGQGKRSPLRNMLFLNPFCFLIL